MQSRLGEGFSLSTHVSHPTPPHHPKSFQVTRKKSLKDSICDSTDGMGVAFRGPEIVRNFWKIESRWDPIDKAWGNHSPTFAQKITSWEDKSRCGEAPARVSAVREQKWPWATMKVITELRAQQPVGPQKLPLDGRADAQQPPGGHELI